MKRLELNIKCCDECLCRDNGFPIPSCRLSGMMLFDVDVNTIADSCPLHDAYGYDEIGNLPERLDTEL